MSFNPKIDENNDKKIVQQQLKNGLSNVNFVSAVIENLTVNNNNTKNLNVDNNTITSVTLLLGHTDKVGFVKKTDSANYNYIPQFRQDIDKDLFFKILDLYILKYGQPTMDGRSNEWRLRQLLRYDV